MSKLLFYTSLPFSLLVCFMCGFLLLQWLSIYWCEQMRELLVITVMVGARLF